VVGEEAIEMGVVPGGFSGFVFSLRGPAGGGSGALRLGGERPTTTNHTLAVLLKNPGLLAGL